MTTLTESPLAPLLDRLFHEADQQSPLAIPEIAALSREQRERMMRSKTEYVALYGRLKDAALPVSRATGLLLYMLARSSGARAIIEFGTSFGISTLHLAAALRDNGGGRIITSEFEPSKVARARQNLSDAGLAPIEPFPALAALTAATYAGFVDYAGFEAAVVFEGGDPFAIEVRAGQLAIVEWRPRDCQ